ncbi:uncharacterized protein LOC116403745 [Cucumis sativus]|uniref:uncharacterized protein LOC101214739 n=1 Tax=Cucumis sativus TaxID=3659 RepID=UPI0012F4D6DD|nr:uncharacterized protein LOC101214739 [Cucumis sativus]XP_031741143.1 uncharacterized protein LOC116403745 [Cucumis sativus]KAE8653272.1 hypothetical protein Csa_023347 [Cucumis sativus]KGN66184.2 hypothetical protein Csa_019645 [Cucumis sativus]
MQQNPFEGDSWPSYFGRSDSFLSFNSPVESEIGSYEIESDRDDGENDGDDYTAELSRRMAQYMLQDDDNSSTTSFQSEIQNKSWGLSGSPISTLWSPLGSSTGSSHGSPEGPSKEPSPPSTPVVEECGELDISHNVFSKLEKMKKVSINGKSIQTSTQIGETGSSSSKDQSRTPKNQKRRQNQQQQQFMKQKGSGTTQVKQAQGSSLQANSGAKSVGPSGTGVFLPRHVNYNRPAPCPQPPQPPKKKGCSTVLIPVRVLQALQHHYDRMDDETRQKITGFTALREAAANARTTTNTIKKSHTGTATATVTTATSQIDVGLPQEWTY